jgi:hypothetical protein
MNFTSPLEVSSVFGGLFPLCQKLDEKNGIPEKKKESI